MKLCDSHFHFPHDKYQKDIRQILQEARAENVEKLVCIGTDLKSSEQAIELAESNECIYAAVGIYPHDEMLRDPAGLKISLESLVTNHKKIVAIGECGIDVTDWSGGRDIEKQKDLFEMQIELAGQYDLPLVIHNRNGNKEITESLTQYKKIYPRLRGVLHCFTGTWEQAQKFLELDFMISFSGIITYPSGVKIHETVKNVPTDKFLVETDAPYLSPQSVRNMVNEPKYVKMTAQTIAALREVPLEKICEYSYQNSCRLFNI